MIVIGGTTRKLQLLLGGAITTNQLPVTVHSVITRAADNFQSRSAEVNVSNNTTAVDIAIAPGNGMNKEVETISVVNKDTVDAAVTIRYNDNATTYNLVVITLSTGDSLYYEQTTGWTCLDSTGALKTQVTENAQDSVGNILTDTDTIDFTYTDATPAITAAVRYQMSITADSSGLKLSGDAATPGNSYFYGTNGSGTKGWYAQTALDHGALAGLADDDHTQYVLGSGARTAITLAAGSADYVKIGGGASASEIRFLEPSGSGTNYTGFKASALAGNVIYTLPDAAPTLNQGVLTASAAGTMSWASPQIGRNAIMNGAFDIWQRGSSTAGYTGGSAYSADRWLIALSGATVATVARSTDVPTVAEAGVMASYSLHLDVTTADASIAAGDYTLIQQRIEGYNWRSFAQRALTLSFWVKATKTGTYCVSLVNTGGDRSYVAEYTVSTTATWEKKTVTFPASPSAGTWDYTTGIGVRLTFTLAMGSTFHTTAGSWQTGQYYATSSHVNGTDSTSNDFRLALVQLEVGSVATDFEIVDFSTEFMRCRRYCQKTFPYTTTPAQNAGVAGSFISDYAYVNGAGIVGTMTFFPTMRDVPTITSYNPLVANANWRDTANTHDAVFGTSSITEWGVTCYGYSTTLAGYSYSVQILATAEL